MDLGGHKHSVLSGDKRAHQTFVVVIRLLSHVQLCDPMDYSMPVSCVLHYLPVCSDSCALSW